MTEPTPENATALIKKLTEKVKIISSEVPNNWDFESGRKLLKLIETTDIAILKQVQQRSNLHKESELKHVAKQILKLLATMLEQQHPSLNIQKKEAQKVHELTETLYLIAHATLMPGGVQTQHVNWVLFHRYTNILKYGLSLQDDQIARLLKIHTPFCYPEFHNTFSKGKSPETISKFLINTVKYYQSDGKIQTNQEYIMLYRRTQPGSTPKPESYWTYSFRIASRGMDTEHSVRYRKTAVYLVADLQTLTNELGRYEPDIKDNSIFFPSKKPFDQKRCQCIFNLG